jgi:ATP-dependent protease ClpP protease subunit
MKKLLGCFVSLSVLIFSTSSVAEVLLRPMSTNKKCIGTIKLRGEITEEMASTVSSVINTRVNTPDCINESSRIVELDSEGGSIDVAMRIGNLFREYEFSVLMEDKDKCLSSCVLILASGVYRVVTRGTVGIHRPYFGSLEPHKSLDDIRKIQSKMISSVASYLETMDVSKKLVDDMMAVEPSEIKILSLEELNGYRLTGAPSSVDEQENAVSAYEHGLTAAEYRSRSQEAWSLCKKFIPRSLDKKSWEKFHSCNLSFILKIPEDSARRKHLTMLKECADLPSYPKSKRQQRWDCKRRVYLGN